MSSARQLCAEVAAKALVSVRRGRDLGALAEDLPPFDADALVAELVRLVDGPIRVALLGYPSSKDLSRRGVEFTKSETTANVWRNDQKASAGIPLFVIVQGTVSKLKSLQSSLRVVTERQIRAVLADKASSWSDTPARRAFWGHLQRSADDFSITGLLELAAIGSEVVRRSNRVDLPDYESKHLHLIGLLPDPNFWDAAGDRKLGAVLSRNASLVDRLRVLTRNDRRGVARVAESEDEELAAVAQRMLAYHRSKRLDLLAQLEFAKVAKVLRPKKTRTRGDDAQAKRLRPMKADEAGFRDAIESGGRNLSDILAAARDGEVSDEEEGPQHRPVEIDGEQVVPRPVSGAAQSTTLCHRLVTAEVFGGVVRADAADAIGCIKLLEADEAAVQEFRPRDRTTNVGAIQHLLETAVAVFGMPGDVVERWREYVAAREALLPIRDQLVACPLTTLLDPARLAAAEQLVGAYARLMDAIEIVRGEISKESGESARDLVAGALALDVIMLQYRSGRVALAGPLHPFHLWRYTQIARIAREHREELKSLSDDQIRQFTEPVVTSPHLVVSNYLDHSLGRPVVFIGAGSLGYLPLYADPDSRVATQLRAAGIGRILEKLVRSAGHAAFGVEVVFVDPPSLADVLDAVLSLNRTRARDERVPMHVRVFRTRPSPSSTDEEEDEMEELAEALRDCRGTLDVDSEPQQIGTVAARLERRQAHYTVFFEPGEACSFRIGAEAMPRRSPILLPRHYKYDRLRDQFTVHVSGDGAAFGAYYSLFHEHLQIPRDAAIGRRSGAQQWMPELARIGRCTMWFSIIDQDVEPTFSVDGAICLSREIVGDRDLLTFTSYDEILDRSLHHLIEEAGLPPTDSTRGRTHRLFRRLGGSLLSEVVGRAATQQCIGLVGVLAIVQWHTEHAPDGIIVSLDSQIARAWILGAVEGDNRRGDMLCVRQTTNGLHLDVIEVKTREDERAVLQVGNGKVSGAAPAQIDNTISALRRILKPKPDVLDCTRLEILRDQLYQAVASQEMDRKQRQRSVAMLEELFTDGPKEISGRVFLVHLEPGAEFKGEQVGSGVLRSAAENRVEVFRVTVGEAPDEREQPLSSDESDQTLAAEVPIAADRRSPDDYTAVRDGAPGSVSNMAPPSASLSTATADEPERPGAMRDGVCVELGLDPLGNPITWDTTVNPAFGILVTGDTGFGKTQTLRAIVAEVRAAGLPVLVFDYKPDYCDPDFVRSHGLTVYDVKRRGLPFNPLALHPDKNGEINPFDQIYEFAEILRRVLDLGEQQENRIVEAQAAAYRRHGWQPGVYARFDTKRRFPSFAEVMEELDGMKKDAAARTSYTRLKKFLDLNLFPDEASDATFDALLSDNVVLAMNELPKELANTLSEVLIVKLHGTLRRGAQPRKIQRLLVFDEAWRVSGSAKLTELAREGRAFGVGLAIGTQNPCDMPEQLVSCLRTQVFLCNKDVESQKAIARAVCGQASGRAAQRIIEQVKNLAKFQAIIISEQYKDGRRVNILPYSERLYSSGSTAPP
jgi:hypothetical protein